MELKLRLAQPEESKQIVDWLNNTPEFDPGILKYPMLGVHCAYNGAGPIAYLPFQRVIMLESLAVNPEAGPVDRGRAYRDLVKGVTLVASAEKIRELYFLATDEKVAKMAINHDFEELPWKVCRMRLS